MATLDSDEVFIEFVEICVVESACMRTDVITRACVHTHAPVVARGNVILNEAVYLKLGSGAKK